MLKTRRLNIQQLPTNNRKLDKHELNFQMKSISSVQKTIKIKSYI